MHGFLLFSHGSLLCGAGCALEEHASRLRAKLGGAPVEIGYLNYSEPAFAVGVQRLVEQGATEIVIVPYFLVPGYFVTHALPSVLVPVRERYPDIVFTIAGSLGVDDSLADAVIESAREATAETSKWRDVYADASASCRIRPDCPIYGTKNCPATTGAASK